MGHSLVAVPAAGEWVSLNFGKGRYAPCREAAHSHVVDGVVSKLDMILSPFQRAYKPGGFSHRLT